MYLLNYDFYDLYALITFFRQNTERFSLYKKPAEQIVSYIDTPMSNNGIELNTIRKILRPYVDKNDEYLSWTLVDNAYTANIIIIKNELYYSVLSTIFKEMLECFKDKQRLYLLCDSSHNIPLLLIDVKNPKTAIKAMISDYQTKYNKNFLLSELNKMESDIFIPDNITELYEKMIANKFQGQLSIENDWITWKLPNNVTFKIAVNNQPHEGYIEVLYNDKNITHWHPMEDEIYKDLFDINTGQLLLIKKRKSFLTTPLMLIHKNDWEKLSLKRKNKYIVLRFDKFEKENSEWIM